VDAGSSQISVLRVGRDGELSRIAGGLVSSNGTEPVSIAIHGHLVYVANAGKVDPIFMRFIHPSAEGVCFAPDGLIVTAESREIWLFVPHEPGNAQPRAKPQPPAAASWTWSPRRPGPAGGEGGRAVGASSGTVAAATALVATETPGPHLAWALGILSSSISLGSAVGPAAGGLATNLIGLRAIFLAGGAMLLLAAIPVVFVVAESPRRLGRAAAVGVNIPALKSLLVRAGVGLVQAAEAGETDGGVIREEISSAHDRGVRPSATALPVRHAAQGRREPRRVHRPLLPPSLAVRAPDPGHRRVHTVPLRPRAVRRRRTPDRGKGCQPADPQPRLRRPRGSR